MTSSLTSSASSIFFISSKPCSSIKEYSSSSSTMSNCWEVLFFLVGGTISLKVKFSQKEDYYSRLEDLFSSYGILHTFLTTESIIENLPSEESEISLFIKLPELLPLLLPWLRVSDWEMLWVTKKLKLSVDCPKFAIYIFFSPFVSFS